jgi:hypothetical protein
VAHQTEPAFSAVVRQDAPAPASAPSTAADAPQAVRPFPLERTLTPDEILKAEGERVRKRSFVL